MLRWPAAARAGCLRLTRQLDLLRRQEPLPSRPLVVMAAAVVAGAATARWVQGPGGPLSLAVPCWAASLVALAGWWQLSRRCRWRMAAGSLVAAASLAGAGWAAARFDLFDRRDLAWQLDATPVPLAVRGTLRESPRALPPPDDDPRRAAAIGPASRCVIAVDAIRASAAWRPAAGRATVIVRAEPADLLVGSRMRASRAGLAARGFAQSRRVRLRGPGSSRPLPVDPAGGRLGLRHGAGAVPVVVAVGGDWPAAAAGHSVPGAEHRS